MKILYITTMPIEYSASANIRNLAVIKGLNEIGYKVDVLCSEIGDGINYVDKSFNSNYINKVIRIQTVKTTKSGNNLGKINIFKKTIIMIIKKMFEYFSIYDNRKFLLYKFNVNLIKDRYDIIISSSDPKSSHLLAKKILKKNPKLANKWIQYWGDPFAIDINRKTIYPSFFIRFLEKNILKLANKIIYVSPLTLTAQKTTYKTVKNKMCFIPIPFVNEKIYLNNEKINYRLGYYGDYKSNDRNIIPLYRAVSDSKKYYLNICGDSDYNLQGKHNIKILPRQDSKTIDKLEENTDILIVICNKLGTQLPGKIFHYAATNKPILIILDGNKKNEIKTYLSKYNRYIFCENNKTSIIKNIEKIFSENKEYFPCKDFNCKNVAKEIIK